MNGALPRAVPLPGTSVRVAPTDFYYSGAFVRISLGEYDQGLRCLEQAVRDRSVNVAMLVKIDRSMDPVRDDPGFQAILEEMGLAD